MLLLGAVGTGVHKNWKLGFLSLHVHSLFPAGVGGAGIPSASSGSQVESDSGRGHSGQRFSGGGSRGRSQSRRDRGLALIILPGLLCG